MTLEREWTAFAGAVFALMGAALASGARRNAEDAVEWERQWRGAVSAAEPAKTDEQKVLGWMKAYRAGGAAFVLLGLRFASISAAGGSAFTARPSVLETAAAGLFFTAAGVFLAANGWHRRRAAKAPGFLAGDPLAASGPAPIGERAALLCARCLIALFVVFGLRLLRGALG